MKVAHLGKDEIAPWHEEFIEFMASPFDKRTYEQFSESVGISDNTLYRYRLRHRDLIAKQVEDRRKKYISEMRSRAMKSLIKKVDKADVNALKLFFQISGDLVERTENKNINVPMTPEEKTAKLKAFLDDLAQGDINSGQGTTPEA